MADVVIYTSAFCGYCARAKRLLKEKGAEFNEISVDMNPALREEMTEKAGGRYTVADAVFVQQVSPALASSYDAEGNLTSQTDQLGRTTAWEYDGLGRVVKETLPDPDGAGALPGPFTQSSYTSLGELVQVTFAALDRDALEV